MAELTRGLLSAVLVLLLCCSGGCRARALDNATYWQQREDLVAQDHADMLGWTLMLTPAEQLVNELLKDAVKAEMEDALSTLNFPPATNFILSKPDIEMSQVFALIRSMPKGAALHVHDSALASIDFVIQELTYWDNLYMCYMEGVLVFRYSEGYPAQNCTWLLVADERAAFSSPQEFDEMIYQQMTLIVDDPHTAYPNINAVWQRFGQYFITIDGLFTYRPAFEAYLTQAMTEFAQDGITYFEFRGTLPLLHELDGRVLPVLETIQVYEDTVNAFVASNVDNFYGVRFIYAPPRSVTEEDVYDYVSLAASLRELHPALVAGFDMVGQEDPGPPLKDFVEPLLTITDQNTSIPVFYHAGETNWYGVDADENLFDALLLNATRLGHGYAITKHRELMSRARATDTPIEVCPISNQVLKLVEDLRNHPAVGLAASSFPLVVSSDDPAAWGALPLSHDFYEAFMAFGGAKADLRFLKQLALNSIKYSSLDAAHTEELRAMWLVQWDNFIGSTLLKLLHNNFIWKLDFIAYNQTTNIL